MDTQLSQIGHLLAHETEIHKQKKLADSGQESEQETEVV
jgi:hypothetical protein